MTVHIVISWIPPKNKQTDELKTIEQTAKFKSLLSGKNKK